jgi:hypothetical protein
MANIYEDNQQQSPESGGVSRRAFLRLTVGVGAALTGRLLLNKLGIPNIDNGLVDGNEYSPRVKELQQRLKNDYGLKLFNGPPNADNLIREKVGRDLNGKNLNNEEIENILTNILSQMNKYPESFWRKNRIKGIRLVKDLAYTNIRVGALFDTVKGEVIINGFDRDGNELLDVAVEELFHHEIYHALDFWTIQKLGLVKSNDKKWIEFHNCGCIPYQNIPSAKNLQNKNLGENNLSNQIDLMWFIGGEYASSNPSEDRAMTAGAIMTHSTFVEVLKKIKGFQNGTSEERAIALILRNKIDDIRKDLYNASNGYHNLTFWYDLIIRPDIINLQYRTAHELKSSGGNMGSLDTILSFI